MLQEVVKRMSNCSYQYHKKGNEAQFLFNATLRDMCSTKKELVKVPSSLSREQQLAITKYMAKLNEGVKAIAVRHRQLGILK